MQQSHGNNRLVLLMTAVIGSLFIVLALVLLLDSATAEATATSAAVATGETTQPDQPGCTPEASCSADDRCLGVTSVPASECMALVALYTKTNGANWISNTNWLAFDSGDAPCDRHGVTCNGGHITELALARNQLSGTLPLALGNLTELSRLQLDRNALQGRIPPSICRLTTTLTDLTLAYNGLYTPRASVERCLQPLAGEWRATQTTPVGNLRLTDIFTNALHLAWTPISYTTDGGYYEIAIADAVNGPYITHGQTTDKHDSTYVITGLEPGLTYYTQIRAFTPPHADQPSVIWSNPARAVGVTKALAGRVLVAAYFPADNDLASEINYVVNRFRLGSALNPNVQVVLLVDGRQDDDTRLLEIAGGQVTLTTAVEDHWGVTELDTADPAVLAWFLQHARANFPAERTVVALMGHGIPPTPEVEWSTAPTITAAQTGQSGSIPPLPKEHELSPSDVTNRSYMSTIDVGEALMAATDNGAEPFDLLFFDQCFQGSLDVLYEVRQTAEIFVASPNYAWLAAPYHKYLTQLTPTATPEAMAQAIINLYQSSLDDRHPNAIFWVRSSDILAVADAVSALGDALRAATQAGETQKIANAVRQSQYVDTTQCGRQNLQLGPPDELIGLESLGSELYQAFGVNDAFGVATALDALQNAMQDIEKRVRMGRPYIAPEEIWAYGNTLTILAPLPRNAPPDVAWRASVYRADAPFTATWTIDPSQTVTVTATLAYAREGRWAEFLAEWYTDLAPTVGQWCHYIPPQQVVVDEVETLTLTATQVATGSVQLTWTPIDDTSATETVLYYQGPYDISWTRRRVIDLGESDFLVDALDPGRHRFAVLARDGDQQYVAQSNEVTVELGEYTDGEQMVFLPLVTR